MNPSHSHELTCSACGAELAANSAMCPVCRSPVNPGDDPGDDRAGAGYRHQCVVMIAVVALGMAGLIGLAHLTGIL